MVRREKDGIYPAVCQDLFKSSGRSTHTHTHTKQTKRGSRRGKSVYSLYHPQSVLSRHPPTHSLHPFHHTHCSPTSHFSTPYLIHITTYTSPTLPPTFHPCHHPSFTYVTRHTHPLQHPLSPPSNQTQPSPVLLYTPDASVLRQT